MVQLNTFYYLSATNYSEGDYSECVFGGSVDCTPTSTSDPDSLANTGYDILLPIFLGISLIVAGLILLTRRWLRKRKQVQEN